MHTCMMLWFGFSVIGVFIGTGTGGFAGFLTGLGASLIFLPFWALLGILVS